MVQRSLNRQILEEMMNGTPEIRKYIGERAPEYFAFYYFSDAFVLPLADFHWDFIEDYERLQQGELSVVMWLAFRESAKTTWAQILVTHSICFRLSRYINWDSYDITNAKQALFDIAMWLQTNERIVRDFGLLFKKKRAQKDKEEAMEPEKKALGEFITTNKVKVEAFSTGMTTRGRKFAEKSAAIHRPDFYVFDDIENTNTVKSAAITKGIIDHVDEAITGMPQTGRGTVLVLGNWISEDGVMAHLSEKYKGKPFAVVRNIPGVIKGQIVWTDKYVWTIADALEVNKDLPREEHKVSLEYLQEKWGKTVYETEFLHNPSARSDFYFDRTIIRRLMDKLVENQIKPIKEVAGQKVYQKHNAQHKYALGADTAGGHGGDSNVAAIIDFSSTPKRLVSIYENNQELPNVFAWTIKRQAEEYGECFVVPELNNTGYGTMAELLNLGYYYLYVREVKNKTTDKMQKAYGYFTTPGNKEGELLPNLKSAVEDGELEILDYDTLNEMYHYTLENARNVTGQGLTKHLDRVMGVALAWEGRKYARMPVSDRKDKYKAPKREAYVV